MSVIDPDERGWMGDVQRPPMTEQETREAALWALAPDLQKGSLKWFEHHLGLLTYKPGWSWSVVPAEPWDPRFMLRIRVVDPNQQLAQRLERHLFPVIGGDSETRYEHLAVRSAVHPDHQASAVTAMFSSPIPPYVDSVDDLTLLFVHIVEQTELQIVKLWLKYRDQPVSR